MGSFMKGLSHCDCSSVAEDASFHTFRWDHDGAVGIMSLTALKKYKIANVTKVSLIQCNDSSQSAHISYFIAGKL